MQVVLVMFRGAEGDRRSFSVTRDVTVIGRREDCDLRIPVSEVSRKHCRIIRDGETVRAEDLGSSNGTYHNGQRISGSVVVEPGDSIQVGPVVFVLQVDGNPPDEELAPFEERAAHHLDDELAVHPPMPEAHSTEEEVENLEVLEETPVEALEPATDFEPLELDAIDKPEPLALEGAPGEHEPISMAEHLNADSTDHGGAIPLSEDSEPLEFELTDEHAVESDRAHPPTHDEPHAVSNEDDLVLDLNLMEDSHEKH